MSQEKRKALGRGLEALLPRKPAAAPALEHRLSKPPETQVGPAAQPGGTGESGEFLEQTQLRPGEQIVEIPLTLIARNSYQTRTTAQDDPGLEELAESIKIHGVLQPVVVRPLQPPGAEGQLYELIAGERRWLASARAGKAYLPAIIRDVPNQQVLVLTIIENLLRQDLNPMQHARALARLSSEFHLTQEEVAGRTGLSRSAVANYLRLVRLPQPLQEAVADGRLGFGQAKVIMALGDTPDRDALARKVMASKLTVRETENLLHDFMRPPAERTPQQPPTDPNVRAAEMDLQRALGCRVQIRDYKGKGKIVIQYKSLEDFDRILEALK
jgi:ParB family chromosome partitioning protein